MKVRYTLNSMRWGGHMLYTIWDELKGEPLKDFYGLDYGGGVKARKKAKEFLEGLK